MLHKAAARIFEKVDVLHGPADWLKVPHGERPMTIQSGVAFPSLCCVKPSGMNTN
jgi:hypothetical protein